MNKILYLAVYLVLLGLSAQTLSAQQLPLQTLKTGWTRIYIENVGSVDLPPTMELQKGLFKEFVDNELNTHGVKVAQLVAQQKGLNEDTKEAFEKYARIMVETDMGRLGDYEKLNFNINELTKADIAELDALMKRQIQLSFSTGGMGQQRLIHWYPLKLEKINGMSCVHINYTRQMNNNPVALVHTYIFFNNDRLHRFILSYRLSESDHWQADFVSILKSFRITNIR